MGCGGRLEDRAMVVVGVLITPIRLTASSSPDPSANTTRNNVLFKETSPALNSHRWTAYYELQNTHPSAGIETQHKTLPWWRYLPLLPTVKLRQSSKMVVFPTTNYSNQSHTRNQNRVCFECVGQRAINGEEAIALATVQRRSSTRTPPQVAYSVSSSEALQGPGLAVIIVSVTMQRAQCISASPDKQ
ncbi:hypothetical protein E1301_Tti001637 [Triplophysa tibetana]|uniref:Uncharacterized protein n=1 Tax=Triplophysa tibetana TaxID=1572043 RepID=A0A5A9P9R5_9TELE|nr:hypothetical protein E1301_Tti001637 [Triplophysa tibetana]